MTNALEQNIIKFIAENKLINSGDKLLIALSGGADSVFALSFFNKYRCNYKIQICTLHINHSLRGIESDSDEEFCRMICNNLNIEFYSEKIDVSTFAKKEKLSIEEAARNIRYKMLKDHLNISKSNKIVTAHNLDDNTETVLLNLFRGTGLKGLSGIPIKRDSIIRPFLSVSKIAITKHLNNEGIKFRIDSTNNENDFKRNYLRNDIIPNIKAKINQRVDDNILKMSQIAKNSYLIVNDLVADNSYKFITYTESEIKISKEIKTTASHLFGEIVKQCVAEKFSVNINYADFSNIQNLIELQVGSKIDLSQNLEIINEREYLIIRKKKIVIDKTLDVKLYFNSEVDFGEKIIGCQITDLNEVQYSKKADHEFIDAEYLIEPLIVRKWREGDRFNPLGLNGSKKVSDFLTEKKVLNINRKDQLVLLNDGKIIWIVGHRIDESIKISKKTKKVKKIWVK